MGTNENKDNSQSQTRYNVFQELQKDLNRKGLEIMNSFCEYCNQFVDTHVKQYSDTLEVKGVQVHFTANGAYCNKCDHQIFDRDLDNEALISAYREYRKDKGLLQPEEIKRIRNKYGLSQVAFAKLLGFGEKTIARYEGGSLQDDAPNSLIYLMDKPANMLAMLKKYGKDRLGEKESQSALKQFIDQNYFEISVFATNLYTSQINEEWNGGMQVECDRGQYTPCFDGNS